MANAHQNDSEPISNAISDNDLELQLPSTHPEGHLPSYCMVCQQKTPEDKILLECNHTACMECLPRFIMKNITNKIIPACEGCGTEISEMLIQKHKVLKNKDQDKYNRFRRCLEVLSEPRRQKCPMPKCSELAEVHKIEKFDVPVIVKCRVSHNFCAICNYTHVSDVKCSRAKNWDRFYDEPLTLRCENCGLILQEWMDKEERPMRCYSCRTPVYTPNMVMLSPFGYFLMYLLLPILMPYLILKYFFCRKDRSRCSRKKCLCGACCCCKGNGDAEGCAILAIVLLIILFVGGFGLMFASLWILPFAYITLILNHWKQTQVEKRLKATWQ